jgi:hypothetical protein
MSDQYLSLYEETTRGTKPASPARKFLPVIKGLAPKFMPKDEPRKEFRGSDTALGDGSMIRKSSQYTFAPECYLYPGSELGLLLKHLLGHAGTRTIADTTAYRGILYPLAMPYGSGAELSDKALGLEPNIDRDGTTKSQTWGGCRLKAATINIKPDEDVTIAFEGQGAGGWVGAPGQTATAGVSFTAIDPYAFSDATFYIGTGADLTGTAPDYTAMAAGTMKQFTPDDMTIKINNGLDDKTCGNGIKGPSKTERTAQFSAQLDFSVDFRDPSSGFSSIDEYEAQFSGPRTTAIMVVLTHLSLAGSSTEHYKEVLYFPLIQNTCESPDPDNEGKQTKAKFSGKTMSPSGSKPLYWMRTDQTTAY